MTLTVRVDATDPTPPYEQLRRQIADAITSGALAGGTRLPTVRQLAGDLGVANGTVMRAYSELETGGLVQTARGAGTTVASMPTPATADRLDDLARCFVAAARLGGATNAQISDAVSLALTTN